MTYGKYERAENTHNYPYEIYAEPTRKLHRTLGLGSSMKAPSGPKKSYVPNILGSVFASLKVHLCSQFLILCYNILVMVFALLTMVPTLHSTARTKPAQLGDQSWQLRPARRRVRSRSR
jgi:hypothetical protein